MTLANYDNATAVKMLHAFVPISRLNKGEPGRILDEVKAEGVRGVVKNNVPECVMVSEEEYDRLVLLASRPVKVIQTKEEERRRAFIRRIRQNVPLPVPATRKLADVMRETGPLDVDEMDKMFGFFHAFTNLMNDGRDWGGDRPRAPDAPLQWHSASAFGRAHRIYRDEI